MMADKARVDVKDNAELRKKIEYQVACEERAHRIVERLIYNPVTQEQLVNALHLITPSHYSDIVEERAISRLCGYPLCPSELSNILKQKYVISTKTNKVYDIEARKNFCSGQCYKASKHLECQVSSDPVWSRKHMRPIPYDLLPLNAKSGKVGDEVIVSKAGEIKDDLRRLEKLETYQKNLAERIHDHNMKTEGVDAANKCENEVIDDDEYDNEKKESVHKKDVKDDDVEGGIGEESITYTLDKAMNELSIRTNEAEENEQSSGHTYSNPNTKSMRKCADTVSKNTNVQEINSTDLKKSSASKNSKRNKDPSKSKTDYLMQLLDKRKALLSKMADIQNDGSCVSDVCKRDGVSEIGGNKDIRDEKIRKETKSEKISIKDINTEAAIEDNTDLKGQSGISEVGSSKQPEDIPSRSEKSNEVKISEKSYCKLEAEKKKAKEFVKDTASSDSKKKTSLTPLDLISRGLSSWVTEKTIEYLRVDDKVDDIGGKNTAFERQYKALVAKVDAQEKDFEGLLGEETMEPDHNEKASAPLPHFEVLRQELEEDQIRVREFMKGSFTYKVQEKQTYSKDDGSNKVLLPTVDRYDQMLIRQKIVLDRINKILPDILPPLHLLVQDIFTELKELIFTFNFTSDNILFKPVEWTIVSLILLRMLSRKMDSVQKSFTSPGAEKYFTVLLSSIGASIERVDFVVDNLLSSDKPRKSSENI